MKKYALPLALLGLVTLPACNQQTSTETQPATQETSAELALDTTERRLSYGIAYNLGQGMAAEGFPVDMDAFKAGVTDALAGTEPKLTMEELTAEMQAFQAQVAVQKQSEAGDFLAANAAMEGVVTTESGLQYKVVEAGEGVMPGPQDTVKVHYKGTLTDGVEFDSSYSRGTPAEFRVDQVIPGWTEALQLMPVGSKWQLTIPSQLAYGASGAGGVIRPHSTLIFDVELLEIVSTAEAAVEAPAEPAAEAPAEG